MAGGGSASTSGQPIPATEGVNYDRHVFDVANDAQRIFALSQETTAMLLRANPDNSDDIYIGFDDQVTNNNGIPLEPGDVLTMDVNVDAQNFWGYAISVNDDVRYALTE